LEEPVPVLLAGLGYPTPWTRDASINAWNGLSILSPQVARNTLLAVVETTPEGPRVIGRDQYWDSVVWAAGAWRHYLVTGDREFLALALEALTRSLAYYEATEFDGADGLFRGPGWSDGVSGYPAEYAATDGASGIQAWPKLHPDQASRPGFGIPMKALSTNCLYYNAYRTVEAMRRELGLTENAAFGRKADRLKEAINTSLWSDARRHYLFLTGPFGTSGHQEALGHAYAILFGIAGERRAGLVFEQQHVAPAGVPSLWPNLDRYRGPDGKGFARHAGTVWPQIQGMWAQAAADARLDRVFGHELFQLARHAVRDRQFAEIYHPLTGEIYGGWQESRGKMVLWESQPRQSWAASAYVRMVLHGLAGIAVSPEGVRFAPCVPAGVSEVRLSNVRLRGGRIDLEIRGTGTRVARLEVDGRERPAEWVLPWESLTGTVTVAIAMR
jgi:glycogen debranching enzyme